MKKTLFTALLSLAAAMPVMTGCQQFGKQLAKEIKEQAKDEEGSPRYLRDSEKWGKVVERTLELDEFDAINAMGTVDVVFYQDDEFSVVAKGNEKVLDLYEIDVENDCLVTKSPYEIKGKVPSIRLIVHAPTLTDLNIHGAGDVYLRDEVNLDNDLSISIHGAGDLDINELGCNALNITIQGAGDLDGYKIFCQNLTLNMSGAGDAKIKTVKCSEDAEVHISGVGDLRAEVVCRDLDLSVSGAGEADLKLDCNIVKATANGTGGIELKGAATKLIRHESGLAKVDTKKLSVDELDRQ